MLGQVVSTEKAVLVMALKIAAVCLLAVSSEYIHNTQKKVSALDSWIHYMKVFISDASSGLNSWIHYMKVFIISEFILKTTLVC